VLGFAREGYEKGSIKLGDVADMLKFPGFWKLIWRYRNHGAHEMAGSIFKTRYLHACQKYCPELTIKDLAEPIAGIRAQAVLNDGSLVQDFLFVSSDRMLHVCNAPSPAATSAMPIGEMIVKKLMQAQA
jgi:L-2-hydroxyglutarate oxidase